MYGPPSRSSNTTPYQGATVKRFDRAGN